MFSVRSPGGGGGFVLRELPYYIIDTVAYRSSVRLNEVFYFDCSLKEEEVEAVKVNFVLWHHSGMLGSDVELGKAALSLARAFVRPLGADHVNVPVRHPTFERWGMIEISMRVMVARGKIEVEGSFTSILIG